MLAALTHVLGNTCEQDVRCKPHAHRVLAAQHGVQHHAAAPHCKHTGKAFGYLPTCLLGYVCTNNEERIAKTTQTAKLQFLAAGTLAHKWHSGFCALKKWPSQTLQSGPCSPMYEVEARFACQYACKIKYIQALYRGSTFTGTIHQHGCSVKTSLEASLCMTTHSKAKPTVRLHTITAADTCLHA